MLRCMDININEEENYVLAWWKINICAKLCTWAVYAHLLWNCIITTFLNTFPYYFISELVLFWMFSGIAVLPFSLRDFKNASKMFCKYFFYQDIMRLMKSALIPCFLRTLYNINSEIENLAWKPHIFVVYSSWTGIQKCFVYSHLRILFCYRIEPKDNRCETTNCE